MRHTAPKRLAFASAVLFGGLFGLLGSAVGTRGAQQPPPALVPASALLSIHPSIAAGNQHTCALSAAGTVRCWGRNEFGQLGDGSFADSSLPIVVDSIGETVSQLATGGDHTCALTVSGGVKCWGYNGDGELGDFTQTNRGAPVDVINLTTGVTAISVGDQHTCALMSGGTAVCWGYNYYGEAGNGEDHNSWLGAVPVCASGSGISCSGGAALTGVTAIAAGGTHSCAITTGGALKCWGNNFNGQLGLGVTPSSNSENNIFNLPQAVPGLSGAGGDLAALKISAGGAETCAIVTGSGVQCWGYNAFGQAGDGSKSTTGPNYPQPSPVAVTGLAGGVADVEAASSPCVRLATGGMQCWGLSDVGQVGDGTTTERHAPVDVSGLTAGVLGISTGSRHNCARTSDATFPLKCWGANDYGQLGNGTTTGQFDPNPLPVNVVIGVDCTGIIQDGHGHNLPYVEMQLRKNGATVRSGTSGKNGQYHLTCPEGADYQIRATLKDASPDGDVFEMWHGDSASEAAWFEANVTVPNGADSVTRNLEFGDNPDVLAANVLPKAQLSDMANVFLRVRQYVDWAKSALGTVSLGNPDLPEPVEFVLFSDIASSNGGAFYQQSGTYVRMDPPSSVYTARSQPNDENPENGEWHEFTHHLFAANITSDPYHGVNHAGWLNQDTTDSMSEAVPMFLATLAWQGIEGGFDSNYDGFGSLEVNAWKAWTWDGPAANPNLREDVALTGLLWDLVDTPQDSWSTLVVSRDGSHHVAVTYQDNIALSLHALWSVLSETLDPHDATVAGLRDALYVSPLVAAAAKTVNIDLDGDGAPDVSPLDEIFLMHGFYEVNPNKIAGDRSISEYTDFGHYWVGTVIGRTDHVDAPGPGTAVVARRRTPDAEAASILLNVHDGGGHPLPGATVDMTIAYPELTTTLHRALGAGDGNLVHLELPPYYQDLLAPGDALPPCDPSNDYQVSVTLTVTYNGAISLDQPQFDNCQFVQALATATGDHTLAFTVSFASAIATATATATATDTPTPSLTPATVDTETMTPTDTATTTPQPTATRTSTPTPSATWTPAPTATASGCGPLIVNSTVDAVDAAPGNCVCATGAAVCTLRAAIMEANASPGADTITIPAGTYILTLTGPDEDAGATGDLDITDDVTIQGFGAATTVIDANSGNPRDRAVHLRGAAGVPHVEIDDVTIQNGVTTGNGGGIYNDHASLTLRRDEVLSNHNTTFDEGSGGGIYNNNGELTIARSTIDGNGASFNGDGGGIANVGAGARALLSNDTVSGNHAFIGGGIFNLGGHVEMRNLTITLNGFTGGGEGGGVDNFSGFMDAANVLFANNHANCSRAFLSLGHNLDTDGSCGLSGPGDVSAIPPSSIDALLGPLQDNGGPTRTFELFTGSPAIDAASDDPCEPIDQRGVQRPQDGDGNASATYDIGAFELEPAAAVSPTSTDTPSATDTSVPTATDTPTPTTTRVPTSTPTATNTSVPTSTNTATATNTSVPTSTNTPTATNTSVPTATVTPTATNTSVPTATGTPSRTSTGTPTVTRTSVPTATATPTSVASAVGTRVVTRTPISSRTPVHTSTATAVTPSATATPRCLRSDAELNLLSRILSALGSRRSDGGYRDDADLNDDGRIDWRDVLRLLGHHRCSAPRSDRDD